MLVKGTSQMGDSKDCSYSRAGWKNLRLCRPDGGLQPGQAVCKAGTFCSASFCWQGRQQLAIRDTFWVMCYQGDPPLQPPIQVAI